MELIVGGRGSGKTRAAVQWAREHGGVIYVATEARRQHLLDIVNDVDVRTFADIEYVIAHDKPFIVDEYQLLEGCPYRPDAVTMSVEKLTILGEGTWRF